MEKMGQNEPFSSPPYLSEGICMWRTVSPAARASRLKSCLLERSLPLAGGILGLSWVGLSEKPVSQAFVPERSPRAGPRIRLSHSNRPYPRTMMSWEISGSMWATLGAGLRRTATLARSLYSHQPLPAGHRLCLLGWIESRPVGITQKKGFPRRTQ